MDSNRSAHSHNHTTESGSRMQPSASRVRSVSVGTALALMTIVGIVGFIAGTRQSEIVAMVSKSFGVRVSTDSLDLDSTQEVYRKLKANFDGNIDTQKLIDGASRGMVAAANDPYTVYMDEEETTKFTDELQGTISGIGAEIGVRDDTPTVLRVLSGSPAERAGVEKLDRIVNVNDTVTAGFDAAKTAELIRGESGTTVKVTVLRGKDERQFTITRASVSDTSVDSSIDDGIGIIKIRRFDTDTGLAVRRAADTFRAAGVRGVIVDLRDNGGGYLDQAQSVAGVWLEDKLVVTERREGVESERLNSIGETKLKDIPTVVLINGSSASASEIVAGALRDHHAARIIGEKSFGKGSVQQIITLNGGTQLKVTVAKWYTPSGKSIEKTGITPDIESKLTLDDLNNNRDPQLARAVEELKK